jgi:hypothetical protein
MKVLRIGDGYGTNTKRGYRGDNYIGYSRDK